MENGKAFFVNYDSGGGLSSAELPSSTSLASVARIFLFWTEQEANLKTAEIRISIKVRS